MNLTAVSSFIEDVQTLKTPGDVQIAFEEFLQARGFHHFACCSHIDYAAPPSGSVFVDNYPDEWAHYFVANRLERYDPVLAYCRQKLVGFNWSDPGLIRSMNQKQADIMFRAAGFGLRLGHTIPFHYQDHHPASLSVSGSPDAMQKENIYAIQLVAPYLYQKLYEIGRSPGGLKDRPKVKLSDLEFKCLIFAAQGKSDWDIAQICDLTTGSVAHALGRVRAKFGVSSRVQATVHALHNGYLDFHTIMNP